MVHFVYNEDVEISFSEAGRLLTVPAKIVGPAKEGHVQVEVAGTNIDFRGNDSVGFGDRVDIISDSSPVSLASVFTAASPDLKRVTVSIAE
ncbi:MAG: hypothetical protein AAF621_07395 [Pseudomonadota bacterium]